VRAVAESQKERKVAWVNAGGNATPVFQQRCAAARVQRAAWRARVYDLQ